MKKPLKTKKIKLFTNYKNQNLKYFSILYNIPYYLDNIAFYFDNLSQAYKSIIIIQNLRALSNEQVHSIFYHSHLGSMF